MNFHPVWKAINIAGIHGDKCFKLLMDGARVLNDYMFKHGDG